MRRTAAAVSLSALLLAGCTGGEPAPVELAVTTPPASATAGPPATSPATSPATPPPGRTVPPGSVPPPAEAGPAAAYRALAADWQRARSAFFTAVSDGTRRTVAGQRALAADFLAAQRAFAAGLRGTAWPAPARPAVAALLARNAGQQATLAAMAAAGSAGEFTGRLADYGVATAAEQAAVAAVSTALSR